MSPGTSPGLQRGKLRHREVNNCPQVAVGKASAGGALLTALLAVHPPRPLLCRLLASRHLGPSLRGGLGQQGLGQAPSAVEPDLQLCFISFLAVYVGIVLHPGKSDTVLAPGTRPGRSLHENGSRGDVEAAVQPRPCPQVDREAHGSEGIGDGLRGGPGLAP